MHLWHCAGLSLLLFAVMNLSTFFAACELTPLCCVSSHALLLYKRCTSLPDSNEKRSRAHNMAQRTSRAKARTAEAKAEEETSSAPLGHGAQTGLLSSIVESLARLQEAFVQLSRTQQSQLAAAQGSSLAAQATRSSPAGMLVRKLEAPHLAGPDGLDVAAFRCNSQIIPPGEVFRPEQLR